jgi:hypothetical protein
MRVSEAEGVRLMRSIAEYDARLARGVAEEDAAVRRRMDAKVT